MLRMFAIGLAAGSCQTLALAQQPSAERLLNFDDGAKVEGRKLPKVITPGGSINATIDPGTILDGAPRISSSGCYSPPKCLRLSMAPSAPNSKKNKILFNIWSHHKKVPGGQNGIIRINDGRVTNVSFAMKLGAGYSTPIHNLLHFQVSQTLPDKSRSAKMDYVPAGPIISLNMVPKSRRADKSSEYQEFVLSVRYPGANKFRYYDRRDKTVLYRGKMKIGEWYRFGLSFALKGGNDQPQGNIRFRLNGEQKVNYNGPIGFSPKKYGSSDTVGIDLGIYRTPDKSGRQTVYFDDVKVFRPK
ncbi:hypothetical protein LL253_00185 [Sphingobium soli]|jgi:hypothetical protein|uniref:Polysaccharide lyase-like protein n=1 Tax=Sphingobium soli TaxID=1591116 RepID=A0ABS8GXU0_9SPHN|nr:hypothetical protein [Sphingobium soli]MCC4231102.1 hypothetical protein [Sphingobium soli]